MVDLDQFYEENIKDKDADEIAEQIYALTEGSVTGGIVKAFIRERERRRRTH